jgi:hypothetical protein
MKIYQITEIYNNEEGFEVYRLTNHYKDREQATNAFEIRTNMLLQSNELLHIFSQVYNNEECYGKTHIMIEVCSEIELELIEVTLV